MSKYQGVTQQDMHEFEGHSKYRADCAWCNEQRADMDLKLARPMLDTAIRTGRFSAWASRVHAGQVAQANAYATFALLAEQRRTNALLEQIAKQTNPRAVIAVESRMGRRA